MAGENSGGRAAPPPIPAPRTMRERFGALRNLPPFLKLVWQTSPALTVGDLALAPRPRAAAGRHALRRQAHHR